MSHQLYNFDEADRIRPGFGFGGIGSGFGFRPGFGFKKGYGYNRHGNLTNKKSLKSRIFSLRKK